MTITKETREDMAKVLGQVTVSEKTAQDILLICKAGVTAREALSLRGIDNPNPDTVTDLKKKSEIWLLSSPDLQKLAHHAVRDTLKMKPIKVKVSPYGDEDMFIYPQVSNRLAAAAMVTDRTEPIKQDHGPQQVTNNIQVNVRELFNAQHVVIEDNGQGVIIHESNENK